MTSARTWHVQGCIDRAGTWRKVNKMDDTWKKVLNLWTEEISSWHNQKYTILQHCSAACIGMLRASLAQAISMREMRQQTTTI